MQPLVILYGSFCYKQKVTPNITTNKAYNYLFPDVEFEVMDRESLYALLGITGAIDKGKDLIIVMDYHVTLTIINPIAIATGEWGVIPYECKTSFGIYKCIRKLTTEEAQSYYTCIYNNEEDAFNILRDIIARYLLLIVMK